MQSKRGRSLQERAMMSERSGICLVTYAAFMIYAVTSTSLVIKTSTPKMIYPNGTLVTTLESTFKACGIDLYGIQEQLEECASPFGNLVNMNGTSYNLSGYISNNPYSDTFLTDYQRLDFYGFLLQKYQVVRKVTCGSEPHSITQPDIITVGVSLPTYKEPDKDPCTQKDYEEFNKTGEVQDCMSAGEVQILQVKYGLKYNRSIVLTGTICQESLGCGLSPSSYNFLKDCYQVNGEREILLTEPLGENPQLYIGSMTDMFIEYRAYGHREARRRKKRFINFIAAAIIAGIAYDKTVTLDEETEAAFKRIDKKFDKTEDALYKVEGDLNTLGERVMDMSQDAINEKRQRFTLKINQDRNLRSVTSSERKILGSQKLWLSMADKFHSVGFSNEAESMCEHINETLVTIRRGLVFSTVICSPMGSYPYTLNGTFTDLFTGEVIEEPTIDTNTQCTRLIQGNVTDEYLLREHFTITEKEKYFDDRVFKDPKHDCVRLLEPARFVRRMREPEVLVTQVGQVYNLTQLNLEVNFESSFRAYRDNLGDFAKFARKAGQIGQQVLIQGTGVIAEAAKAARWAFTNLNPIMWLLNADFGFILSLLVALGFNALIAFYCYKRRRQIIEKIHMLC